MYCWQCQTTEPGPRFTVQGDSLKGITGITCLGCAVSYEEAGYQVRLIRSEAQIDAERAYAAGTN